jgi:hypothetical protein
MEAFEDYCRFASLNGTDEQSVDRKEQRRIGFYTALLWMKKEVQRFNREEGYHLIDVFKLAKVIEKELETP